MDQGRRSGMETEVGLRDAANSEASQGALPVRNDRDALTQRELDELISRPKPIADGSWRGRLAPKATASDPANRRGAFQFTDTEGTEWLIYTRESLNNAGNWSVGLIYDPHGANLRFVRCNGPHAAVHQNRLDPLDPPIIVTPHVHTIQERYLQHPRTNEDGHAIPTTAYKSLQEAIEHLAALATLVPEGRLML